MRPGHLELFDGMRVSIEHMDYFQGSLHSAIQDLREILGLGRVHVGLKVVRVNDHTIAVEPGVAFDWQRRRIPCDEPKTIDVTFGADETQLFVCVKYKQVMGGEEEGHFTTAWDSCDVVTMPVAPTPADNVVPLAVLHWRPFEEGGFVVASLITQDDAPVMPFEEVANAGAAAPADASSSSAPPSTPARFRIEQGLLRLGRAGSDERQPLPPRLLDELRARLAAGPGRDGGADILVTLDRIALPVAFAPASLTSHAFVNGVLEIETSPSAPQPATASLVRFAARSDGEVVPVGETFSQLAITSMGAMLEFTDRGIAAVPFTQFSETARLETVAGGTEVLEHLELRLHIARRSAHELEVVCAIAWKGAVTDALLQAIETGRYRIGWSAAVVWKAIGAP